MPVPELDKLTDAERARALDVLSELARRKMEGLKLYRPMMRQLPFHLSTAKYRLVRGGNRSGKSQAGYAEIASAATGIPLIGPDGRALPFQYPTKHPLKIWLIGYEEKYIGQVMYDKLFRPGSFKIIQDLKTKEWRAWKPWEESDKARERETVPGPPLIPQRLIDPKGWAWESMREKIFRVCVLKNGTEIHAFSSGAEPMQGVAVDIIHIDEDVKEERHVAEWKRRLADNRGRLIWTAFPHSRNNALVTMSEQAAEQKDRENPDVHETILRFHENPFIDDDQKRILDETAMDDDERRSRDSGEFLTDNVLVYPGYTGEVHGIPRKVDVLRDNVDLALEVNGWQPPADWTRYLALDPGHVVAAVLFAAVPPPRLGDFVVIYDELYLRKHDAYQLAEKVHGKVAGHVFEAFLIDNRAGRRTPEGYAKTIRQNYSEAFAKYGIKSIRTGSDFLAGSDDKTAGIWTVRKFLMLRPDGTTKLRFVLPATRATQKEFGMYKKKSVGSDVSEDTVDKNNHAMDCLRYLCVFNPQYVRPESGKLENSPAYQNFLDWEKRNQKDKGAIHVGPVESM